jgi:hypothetical protein
LDSKVLSNETKDLVKIMTNQITYRFGIVLTVWYFGIVPTVWYFGIAPTVWHVLLSVYYINPTQSKLTIKYKCH